MVTPPQLTPPSAPPYPPSSWTLIPFPGRTQVGAVQHRCVWRGPDEGDGSRWGWCSWSRAGDDMRAGHGTGATNVLGLSISTRRMEGEEQEGTDKKAEEEKLFDRAILLSGGTKIGERERRCEWAGAGGGKRWWLRRKRKRKKLNRLIRRGKSFS
eukprot:560467-Hanusia_phi.AAC.3